MHTCFDWLANLSLANNFVNYIGMILYMCFTRGLKTKSCLFINSFLHNSSIHRTAINMKSLGTPLSMTTMKEEFARTLTSE